MMAFQGFKHTIFSSQSSWGSIELSVELQQEKALALRQIDSGELTQEMFEAPYHLAQISLIEKDTAKLAEKLQCKVSDLPHRIEDEFSSANGLTRLSEFLEGCNIPYLLSTQLACGNVLIL